jgi:adenylate cyclase
MQSLIARIRRFATGHGRIPGAILLVGVLILQVIDPPLVESLRLRSFDVLQRLSPRVEKNYPIVIVDIDEKSLQAQGQWPWPRTKIAQIVSTLMDAKAIVVAFDMVFAEPDRTSPSAVADELMSVSPDLASGLFSLPDHDTEFAEVLKRSRVVLGEVGTESGGVQMKPASSIGRFNGNPIPYLFPFQGLIPNIPVLSDAAAGRGNFALPPDVDGLIRRVPAIVLIGKDLHPSLAIEALRVATGRMALTVKMDKAGIASVVVAKQDVITDQSGQIWIRYGKHDPQRFISADDILTGNFNPARVAGRIVLVGASAQGLRDVRATPVERYMPGTEIHAQLLETILESSYLRRPSAAQYVELSVVGGVGILLLVFVPLLGARWTILLPIGVAAAMPAVSWYSFGHGGFLIDATYPTLATAILYLVLVYFGQVAEERRRKAVSRNFAQYLSPVVVERLARDPNPPKLGGEQRDMTVVFVDIAGFTTLSERFKGDPEGLTHLINRFLTTMSESVLQQEGTIDKYIGDAMMAFWNAPVDLLDHAARGCAAALAMVDGLNRLNAELAAEAQPVKGTGNPAANGGTLPTTRIEQLESDAHSGIAQAQYQLAKAYRDGAGVEQSVEMALRWLRAAADQGDARAQRNLGLRYVRGNGVQQDDREALFWLSLAQLHLDTVADDRAAVQSRLGSADVEAVQARVAAWKPAPIGSRVIRMEMGIGLNTGLCLAGNLGSKFRFNYSVMGDPVNLASRLEAQTRTYGVDVIVSESTRDAAPAYAFLELDLIAVKGKTEAVRIFALLGTEVDAQTEQFRQLIETHGRFLAAYRAQQWGEARELLKACRPRWDGLGELYDLYARRITMFEDNPPGADWNGVYVAHSK